ncbi:MAG: glycosyltransferase family 4 protein [Candidatus Omnitrophica bacterium]|nr:glycosyltransferase family 4 protein [Candidatus Omnitrophota bacterium]
MEKIKVMRIIARLNIGGPAIHAVLLNEGLDRDGFDTCLVTGLPEAREGDMTCLAGEKRLNVAVIPELGRNIRPWADIVALWKLFMLIRKERPAIVHTHTAKAGVLGRCAAILNGVPVKVHSFHGHVFHDYFSPVTTKAFILIEKIFARFTDRIIVVSDIIKEDICDNFKIADRSKTSVIRLGLDLEQFRNADKMKGELKRELGIGQDTLLAGIVGRLAPIKNHMLFFDAVRFLKKEVPGLKIRFLIVGDGELRSDLVNYADKLGITDLLLFLGWRQDMPRIYADLDIVVLTSLNEGTPLSLIEAMAAKRPVVATAVGGVPNLVEHEKTGLLVESNNAFLLKEAVLRLLSDEPLRRRLGESASGHVCAAYSKERLIRDMKNLYKQLLETKGISKGDQRK